MFMRVHSFALKIKSIEIFLKNIYESVLACLKIIILSKFNNQLSLPKGESCIILGNGPSLKNVLLENKTILLSTPLVAVNNFATSSEFQELKPAYYVMLDPGYFLYKLRPDVMATFNELKNNTHWEMILFIPYLYRKDPDVQYMKKTNAGVKIGFFNYTIAKGFHFFAFRLFKKNLAMPQFFNVLGASIFLAVNIGYKKIWITGADHSWVEQIHVTKDNLLCRKDVHFYDKAEPSYTPVIDPVSGKNHTVGVFFEAMFKTFDSYYILNKYAVYRQVHIYNTTQNSFIDAFDKKELKELQQK
jgi:hypothetical protein